MAKWKGHREFGSNYCRVRVFDGEREERFRAFWCFAYGDDSVGLVQTDSQEGSPSVLFSKRQWEAMLRFLERAKRRREKGST